MSDPPPPFIIHVDRAHAGIRLDALIAAEIDDCSRSFAATLIRKGSVQVDGTPRKPAYAVKTGETICGTIDAPEAPVFKAENIPLDILYEDAELIFLNKPAGMVVHPSPGHPSGTLVNALMHHCPDLAGISGSLRPGIVHRLDKDTSGVMVAAKNNRSMHALSEQFKNRDVRKRYLTLIFGLPQKDSGSINRPIGRHPTERKRMSVTSRSPRAALTHWQMRERFNGVSLLEVDIRTGRTHQIRVHCQSIGHPIVGDPIYCSRGSRKMLAAYHGRVFDIISPLKRQMLHAWKLRICHPLNGRQITVEAPLPQDLSSAIGRIRDLSR